nr:VOC family protein [uncultured Acetobacterium sp.]
MGALLWDHTIHYVNDLQQANTIFEKNGLKAKYGGSHEGFGTCNSLSYFWASYVEFLAIEDVRVNKNPIEDILIFKDASKILSETEAFGRIGLRTHDIADLRNRLSKKKLSLSEIFAGNRMTPDGEKLTWKLLMINGGYNGLPYPFIIDWEITEEQRFRELKAKGLINQHPLGQLFLYEGVFEVENPKATTAHWADIFNLAPKNENTLIIGQQLFRFEQGKENRLIELNFLSDGEKAFDFEIGEGRYRSL